MAKERTIPQARTDEPLVIQYTNLLQKYRDPNAQRVKDFKREHAGDKVFMERAEVLEEVFKLKNLVNTDSDSGI
jgi:hypothetical protein